MAAVDDVDKLIERLRLAMDEFQKGNPKPTQELFSHKEDVTLANPLALPLLESAPSHMDGSRFHRHVFAFWA